MSKYYVSEGERVKIVYGVEAARNAYREAYKRCTKKGIKVRLIDPETFRVLETNLYDILFQKV